MMTMDKGLNGRKVETMGKKSVVPVLPIPAIEQFYSGRPWCDQLMTVRDFVDLAIDRQARLLG